MCAHGFLGLLGGDDPSPCWPFLVCSQTMGLDPMWGSQERGAGHSLGITGNGASRL